MRTNSAARCACRVVGATGWTPEEDLAPYRERLDYELDVITMAGFAGYLIVADFIKWAKANDIPVGPGRGSGAAPS